MREKISSKCESCGASLGFNPEGSNLKCTNCGRTYVFSTKDSFKRRGFDMDKLSASSQIDKANVVIPKCRSCGASLGSKIISLSAKCEYCGATMVVDDIGSMPDACVPFAFGKDSVKEKFVSEIKNRFWVPKSLKKEMSIDKIDSIYVPAYSFSTNISGSYKGRLYTKKTDDDGNTHIRRFDVSGLEYADFDDVMVECSEHLTQGQLQSIEPFDLSKAKAFSNGFIYGYSVEYYNRTVEESGCIAREIMTERLKKKILARYHYDGVDYLNVTYTYKDSDYAYVLLPIYKINLTYRKKKYSPIINGQTGKMGGKLPVSGVKIFILVLIILAIVGGLVFWVASDVIGEIIGKYFMR